MRKREYRDYLQDILEAIDDIHAFTAEISFDDFLLKKEKRFAVIKRLEDLGEASKKVPKYLKEKYPLIPRKKMAGMRDKLSHEYFGIDMNILWNVVQEDIPPLRP